MNTKKIFPLNLGHLTKLTFFSFLNVTHHWLWVGDYFGRVDTRATAWIVAFRRLPCRVGFLLASARSPVSVLVWLCQAWRTNILSKLPCQPEFLNICRGSLLFSRRCRCTLPGQTRQLAPVALGSTRALSLPSTHSSHTASDSYFRAQGRVRLSSRNAGWMHFWLLMLGFVIHSSQS